MKQEAIENWSTTRYCAANLSKNLVEVSKLEGKTLALIKPCDSYSLNQLLCEHRVKRENVYVLGVGCKGMEEQSDGLCMKCAFCKGKELRHLRRGHRRRACREVPSDRFAEVHELEEQDPRGALRLLAQRAFQVHPLQRLPQRLPGLHLRQVRV